MPLFYDFGEFLDHLPPVGQRGARLLGGDLGTKTLGLALSDEGRYLASPLETLSLTKFSADAALLEKIITREKIGGFVLGWPLNMDGSISPRAQASRQFLENLNGFSAAFAALPMTLFDERLSTAAVERMMIEADLSRKRRDALVDKLAASYILQGALDLLAGYGPND